MREKDKKNICIVCKQEQRYMFSYHTYDYYRCYGCGLVTTYPIPTNETLEKHYKKRFQHGNYELLQKYSEDYKNIYKSYVDILEKIFLSENQTLENKKVLDIGCFTADFLELLQKKGADVYGVELQKDAVNIARKKVGDTIMQADIMDNIKFRTTFDVITLFGVVEHVTDPVSLIKKAKSLLNKEGLLFIQTPNSGSLFAKILKKYWPPYSPVEHIHLFTKRSMEQLLTDNGFYDMHYRNHVKKLPINYVYNILENFGPEFYNILKPISSIFSVIGKYPLPFYIGEMMITAKKK